MHQEKRDAGEDETDDYTGNRFADTQGEGGIAIFYSLKNRLIAFFVVLLVLSFGTMSLLLFNQSRSIIRSYIESSALEKMDEYGSFINMALQQSYDLSSLVYNSDITQRWDAQLSNPASTEGQKMLSNITMSKFLTQTTNNYSIVSSVTIYRQEGMRIGADNQVVTDASFKQETWYRNFIEHSNHWVPAHTDQVEIKGAKPYEVVSLLLPIGIFEPSLAKNVMKVNIKADFLLEPLNRIHLGESGTIFLLNQQGNPILSQQEYSTYPEAAAEVRRVRAGKAAQGVVYLKDQKGASHILVYKKLAITNWLLVGFVSEQDLYAKLFKLRNSIIVFASLMLIAAFVLAYWISYGITKPLSRLVSAMRHVQKGDFAQAERLTPPERRIRNEVDYATDTFRSMVKQLRYLIRTEFEQKLLRQQAEYKALLMQINPHFLFNTLELMSSLAIQQRTKETVTVIESLGKMLRFSLRISEDLIPLREELKYVRYYMSILDIRFGPGLDLRIEEAGELDDLEIVKFLLQPLIENAVKYSFIHQANARVRITVRQDKERLYLAVADNGIGMAPELLRELNDQAMRQQLEQLLQSKTHQIGLRNVLARCWLYYGDLFSFRIDSSEQQGTSIELSLPIQRRNEDVSRIDRG
ncbi:sensor histidine kinase [Paenibacillus sp. FSL E2-0178]|uniref:sensor histidine kinase n=1 Tax=Paenibacillus sp. FSL E2-0178 TaxID=2921361 RepID=UPI00315858DD